MHVLVGSCPCWLVCWHFVVNCSYNMVNIQCHLRLPTDCELDLGSADNESHCSQENCPAGATFSGRSPGKSVDSTSVTSPRRARIFWKFSGRSSRLVDV